MINIREDYDKAHHSLMPRVSFLVDMLREPQACSVTRMACYPAAQEEKEGHRLDTCAPISHVLQKGKLNGTIVVVYCSVMMRTRMPVSLIQWRMPRYYQRI
jgi:hypothetical protein